jgi:acetolactate synthase-1/2/3 large subunit
MARTGGELVLDSLKAAGIETAFGIISVHNIPIFDAIAREGGMRLVPARTEHGAAAMADGLARSTGRMAAVITSTGVGAANAAGALLEAFSASSPLIHVTGQVDQACLDEDRGFLHGAKDQLSMLDRVGKAAFRATSTEAVPEVMRTAIQLARSGRPGPVSVEIPIDQQYRSVTASVDPIAPPDPVPPDSAAIDRAAGLLRQAKRPLIWAGGGAIASGASDVVRQLAERLGAGVLTSAAGRGSIPEDHPQCIGFFPVDQAVAELYANSDLLLLVGTRLRGNETRNWQLQLPSPRIQIDVEPSLLGRNYSIDVGIVGDARLALSALLEALPPRQADADWLGVTAKARRAARARARATLGPYERILDDLRSTLSRDAIVVRDVTIPATTWGSRLMEAYLPRTVVHPATYAIGMGVGLAIGAAVGQPARDVVLLVGDGGFITAVGELATAAQERLRLRVVLFNDGGYGILRNLQDHYFEGRRLGVDLKTPDFLQAAESFGVWSGQVRSAVEMGPMLSEALQQDGPALIEVDMLAVGPMATPFTGSARLVPGR